MFASVVWPRGRPPSDKPECGFNNELCEWLINGKSNTCKTMQPVNTPIIQVFMLPFRPLVKQTIHSGQANHLFYSLSRWLADITLLALLVTFPVIGVVAVLCIGVLILQKLRLQAKLDDSCWWLINYSDITIIRERSV